MRKVATAFAVLMLVVATGLALADPMSPDAKDEWISEWDYSGARSIVPEIEPNNPCPTSQTVFLGDIVDPAAISPAGDYDYYKIYLLTTDRLTVVLDKATGCTTGIDTYMDIYRSNCTTVVFSDDDDGPGLYSYIRGSEWTPPYDGDYYVRVRHYSSTGTGCYKIYFYAGLNGMGACCSNTGVCTLVEPGSCNSPSVYKGPGTVCNPNPCAPPPNGACCEPNGTCTITTQANCVAPNVWYGQYTTCSPNPCPQPQPNDTCAGALPLQRCSSGSIAGTMAGATNGYDPGVPGPSCTGYSAAGPDLAYVLNLVAGDVLYIVYTTPTYDGSIYLVTDCANVSASCVIGVDDPEPETFTYTVPTTGTYYLIADAYSSPTTGTFTLDWSVTCLGTCCLPDGSCLVNTEADCLALGGTWLGPTGPPCDPNPCPQPPGACCFPDGSCQFVPREQCEQMGGLFLGGPCDPNPCPQPYGVCCFADGTCQVLTEADCLALGGAWNPAIVSCDPNPCPQPFGACCYPDGSCAVTLQAECQGQWIMFEDCDPNPCPQPFGACCYPDGTCIVTLQADCPTGDWRVFLTCEPNPCPQPPPLGACCFTDGTCQVLIEAECGGEWQGAGTGCDPNLCPPPVPVERTTWGQIKNKYR